MRYPRPVLAAGLVGLSLLAAAPVRAQVAETVRISRTEPASGGGVPARRPAAPVFAQLALPVERGLEASDRQFHKVRGDLLNPNAIVFTTDRSPGTMPREPRNRALPYRDYDAAAPGDDDRWALLNR